MLGRFAVATAVAALLVAALPRSAAAHQPIVLGEGDTTPADGPLIPDGTISFAVYGTLEHAGDRRGFRASFATGDELVVGLLIPDVPPEAGLPTGDLPVVTVIAPDGTEITLPPERGDPFLEPFTGTRYVELGELRSVAADGTYGFSITGPAPARFTVSVGTRERFGTDVEDEDRPTRLRDVRAWYTTPPGAHQDEVAGTTPSTTEPVGRPDRDPEPAEQASVAADDETNSRSFPVAPVIVGVGALLVAGAGAWRVRRSRHTRTPG
jgi:hypothetical protein